MPPAATGQLIRRYRRAQRPRWTQHFLAEELTNAGLPSTRSRVAHLELAAPNRNHCELLAAAAYVLGIPADEMIQALAQDFREVYAATALHAETQRLSARRRGTAAPR